MIKLLSAVKFILRGMVLENSISADWDMTAIDHELVSILSGKCLFLPLFYHSPFSFSLHMGANLDSYSLNFDDLSNVHTASHLWCDLYWNTNYNAIALTRIHASYELKCLQQLKVSLSFTLFVRVEHINDWANGKLSARGAGRLSISGTFSFVTRHG